MKNFVLSVLSCLLCVHILWSSCLPPRTACTAAAAEEQYACALSYDVYFYAAADENSGLFCIPYTYYVKILSAGEEYCYVQYSADEAPYTALYGYCRTDKLYFVDFVPERPFLFYPLEVTYSLEGSSSFPTGDNIFSDVTLTYAYYGDYTVGTSTYWYVALESETGYLPKTMELSYELNTDYEASMPGNTGENEVDWPSVSAAQIALGAVLTLLAAGVAYYLFRPRRSALPKAENDPDG